MQRGRDPHTRFCHHACPRDLLLPFLRGVTPPGENGRNHIGAHGGTTNAQPMHGMPFASPVSGVERSGVAGQRREQNLDTGRVMMAHDDAIAAVDGQSEGIEDADGGKAVRRETGMPDGGGVDEGEERFDGHDRLYNG